HVRVSRFLRSQAADGVSAGASSHSHRCRSEPGPARGRCERLLDNDRDDPVLLENERSFQASIDPAHPILSIFLERLHLVRVSDQVAHFARTHVLVQLTDGDFFAMSDGRNRFRLHAVVLGFLHDGLGVKQGSREVVDDSRQRRPRSINPVASGSDENPQDQPTKLPEAHGATRIPKKTDSARAGTLSLHQETVSARLELLYLLKTPAFLIGANLPDDFRRREKRLLEQRLVLIASPCPLLSQHRAACVKERVENVWTRKLQSETQRESSRLSGPGRIRTPAQSAGRILVGQRDEPHI